MLMGERTGRAVAGDGENGVGGRCFMLWWRLLQEMLTDAELRDAPVDILGLGCGQCGRCCIPPS